MLAVPAPRPAFMSGRGPQRQEFALSVKVEKMKRVITAQGRGLQFTEVPLGFRPFEGVARSWCSKHPAHGRFPTANTSSGKAWSTAFYTP